MFVSIGGIFGVTLLGFVGRIKLLAERDLYITFFVSISNFLTFFSGLFFCDYSSSDNLRPEGEFDYFA